MPRAPPLQLAKWRERIGTEMEFAERFAEHQEGMLTDEDRAEMERLSQVYTILYNYYTTIRRSILYYTTNILLY